MVFGFIAVAGAEIAALATTVGLEVSSMGGDGIDDMVAKDNAQNREEALKAQRDYVAHARQQNQGSTDSTMIVSILSACSVLVCCMMVASMMMLSMSNE